MAETTITVERNSTHGSFVRNADVSQAIKSAMRSSPHWLGSTTVTKEALEMIALKVSRILSGQEDFADHWIDIEGYARLGRYKGEAR